MFELMPFNHRARSLFDDFDRLENEFFNMPAGAMGFRTDIIEKQDKFLLRSEIPGFKKEDISINIGNGCLTITAEHKEEKEAKEGEKYIRKECSYGTLMRSFDISNINEEKIKAQYKDGVLELELPKYEKALPQTRKIEIES